MPEQKTTKDTKQEELLAPAMVKSIVDDISTEQADPLKFSASNFVDDILNIESPKKPESFINAFAEPTQQFRGPDKIPDPTPLTATPKEIKRRIKQQEALFLQNSANSMRKVMDRIAKNITFEEVQEFITLNPGKVNTKKQTSADIKRLIAQERMFPRAFSKEQISDSFALRSLRLALNEGSQALTWFARTAIDAAGHSSISSNSILTAALAPLRADIVRREKILDNEIQQIIAGEESPLEEGGNPLLMKTVQFSAEMLDLRFLGAFKLAKIPAKATPVVMEKLGFSKFASKQWKRLLAGASEEFTRTGLAFGLYGGTTEPEKTFSIKSALIHGLTGALFGGVVGSAANLNLIKTIMKSVKVGEITHKEAAKLLNMATKDAAKATPEQIAAAGIKALDKIKPDTPTTATETVDTVAAIAEIMDQAIKRVSARAADKSNRPTLNIGLDVGAKKDKVKVDAVLNYIENKLKVRVLEHEIQISNTERTLIPQLERPLTRSELHQLSEAFEQDAIAQFADGAGLLEGPNKQTSGGQFNGDFFLPFGSKGKLLGRAKTQHEMSLREFERDTGLEGTEAADAHLKVLKRAQIERRPIPANVLIERNLTKIPAEPVTKPQASQADAENLLKAAFGKKPIISKPKNGKPRLVSIGVENESTLAEGQPLLIHFSGTNNLSRLTPSTHTGRGAKQSAAELNRTKSQPQVQAFSIGGELETKFFGPGTQQPFGYIILDSSGKPYKRSRLYEVNRDKDNLFGGAFGDNITKNEQLIKDKGYPGWWVKNPANKTLAGQARIFGDTNVITIDAFKAKLAKTIVENTKIPSKVFRVPTGFRQDAGTTAADVITHERELGNTETVGVVSDKLLAELEKRPAEDVIWVAFKKKDAGRYGAASEIEEINLPKDSKVISLEDGDGGFLILKGKFHKANPKVMSLELKEASKNAQTARLAAEDFEEKIARSTNDGVLLDKGGFIRAAARKKLTVLKTKRTKTANIKRQIIEKEFAASEIIREARKKVKDAADRKGEADRAPIEKSKQIKAKKTKKSKKIKDKADTAKLNIADKIIKKTKEDIAAREAKRLKRGALRNRNRGLDREGSFPLLDESVDHAIIIAAKLSKFAGSKTRIASKELTKLLDELIKNNPHLLVNVGAIRKDAIKILRNPAGLQAGVNELRGSHRVPHPREAALVIAARLKRPGPIVAGPAGHIHKKGTKAAKQANIRIKAGQKAARKETKLRSADLAKEVRKALIDRKGIKNAQTLEPSLVLRHVREILKDSTNAAGEFSESLFEKAVGKQLAKLSKTQPKGKFFFRNIINKTVDATKDISRKFVTTEKKQLTARLRADRLAQLKEVRAVKAALVDGRREIRRILSEVKQKKRISALLRKQVQNLFAQETIPGTKKPFFTVAERGSKAFQDRVRLTGTHAEFVKTLKFLERQIRLKEIRMAKNRIITSLRALRGAGIRNSKGDVLKFDLGGLRSLENTPAEKGLLRDLLKAINRRQDLEFISKDAFKDFRKSIQSRLNRASNKREGLSDLEIEELDGIADILDQVVANRRARIKLKEAKLQDQHEIDIRTIKTNINKDLPTTVAGKATFAVTSRLDWLQGIWRGGKIFVTNSRNTSRIAEGKENGVIFTMIEDIARAVDRSGTDRELASKTIKDAYIAARWTADDLQRNSFFLGNRVRNWRTKIGGLVRGKSGKNLITRGQSLDTRQEMQIGSHRVRVGGRKLRTFVSTTKAIVESEHLFLKPKEHRVIGFTPFERIDLVATAGNTLRRKELIANGAHLRRHGTGRHFNLTEEQLINLENSLTEQEKLFSQKLIDHYNRADTLHKLQDTNFDMFHVRIELAEGGYYYPSIAVADSKFIAKLERNGLSVDAVRFMQKALAEKPLSFSLSRSGGKALQIQDAARRFEHFTSRTAIFTEAAPAIRRLNRILHDRRIVNAFHDIPGGKSELRQFREFVDFSSGESLSAVVDSAASLLDTITTQIQISSVRATLGNNAYVFIKQQFSASLALHEMLLDGVPLTAFPKGLGSEILITTKGLSRLPRGTKDFFTKRRTVRPINDARFDIMTQHNGGLWMRYMSSADKHLTPSGGADLGFHGLQGPGDIAMEGIKINDRAVVQGFIWETYVRHLKKTKPHLSETQIFTEAGERTMRIVRETQPDFTASSMSGLAFKARRQPIYKIFIPFTTFTNKAANFIHMNINRANWARQQGAYKKSLLISGGMVGAITMNNIGAHLVNEARRYAQNGFYGRDKVKSEVDHALDVLQLTFGFVYFLDPIIASVRAIISDKEFQVSDQGTLVGRFSSKLAAGIGHTIQATVMAIKDDKFQQGPPTGLKKAPAKYAKAAAELAEAFALGTGTPAISPTRQLVGLQKIMWPTPPEAPYVQNQVHQASGGTITGDIGYEKIRKLMLLGISASEIRSSLRAEVIERTRKRSKHKNEAVKKALASDAYKDRIRRINRLIARVQANK